jgi:hypothetical protein
MRSFETSTINTGVKAPERPIKATEQMRLLQEDLRSQAEKVNLLVEKEYGIKKLLDEHGAIRPEGYGEEGLFSKEELDRDAATVDNRELAFMGEISASRREFYIKQYGVEDSDKGMRKAYRQQVAERPSTMIEMAAVALLSKKLGKGFLVVQTAKYDDYVNGVDTLIIDRNTGKVVGAFDEVHADEEHMRRVEEKEAKIQRIAEKGGERIKYGLKLQDGKLTRESLKDVPVFYIALDTDDLNRIVEGLARPGTVQTKDIFEKIRLSLMAQCDELTLHAKNSTFIDELSAFKTSLVGLKKEKRGDV